MSILENEEAVQNLKKEIPNFDTILIQVCINLLCHYTLQSELEES